MCAAEHSGQFEDDLDNCKEVRSFAWPSLGAPACCQLLRSKHGHELSTGFRADRRPQQDVEPFNSLLTAFDGLANPPNRPSLSMNRLRVIRAWRQIQDCSLRESIALLAPGRSVFASEQTRFAAGDIFEHVSLNQMVLLGLNAQE